MSTSTRVPSTSASAYGIAPGGYRLPAETSIGTVRLQVADLARSIDYYERIIGFRVLAQENGVATLGAESGDRALLELHERPGAQPVPRRGRLGLYHFAILLPDRPALGRFVAHLGEVGAYAGMSDHLVSEAVYLTDPDGLGIEVYADRPRSTWKHVDRQLVMATNPLDAADLVASAAGKQWTGLPEGTVIGHVHLFVGDLAKAEAFYHQGLGFDKVVWNYPGALFMSAGGYHHHLGTNTWAQQSPVATEEDARLLEWELRLPDERDVAAASASLERAGADVRRERSDAIAIDPWGVRIRIIAG